MPAYTIDLPKIGGGQEFAPIMSCTASTPQERTTNDERVHRALNISCKRKTLRPTGMFLNRSFATKKKDTIAVAKTSDS